MKLRHCPRCRCPLPAQKTGRPRRYCSDACRRWACRRRRKRSVHFSSATCEWATPPDLFDWLDRQFSFTLDACASADNAKCCHYFTRKENGLAQPWTGRVWCNPPYGRVIGQWVQKAWESTQSGAAELVVCLVPARVDTSWWHEYCDRGEVRFLRGRLRFGGAGSSAPFPSALVVFRDAQQRHETDAILPFRENAS
jgi:phage N-6-adenine-methyltransferase